MNVMNIFTPLKNVLRQLKRLVVYRQYDSSDYWRKRAGEPGQAKVLWKNETYNRCYRRAQQKIIRDFLPEITGRYEVLDIGCGIGVVAKMLAEMDSRIHIDAVDFAEMIAVARGENADDRIHYIASSAETYFDPAKHYDLVISSACFSAIRDLEKLRQAVINCAAILKDDGRMLMIDPFHRWKYLARARFSSGQMISLLDSLGFSLTTKSGVIFWPYREWLANSEYPPEFVERKFRRGERWLAGLGQHLWADYKVLGFRRRGEGE